MYWILFRWPHFVLSSEFTSLWLWKCNERSSLKSWTISSKTHYLYKVLLDCLLSEQDPIHTLKIEPIASHITPYLLHIDYFVGYHVWYEYCFNTWKLIILCDWLIIEEISFNYSTAWSNLVNQDNNVVPGVVVTTLLFTCVNGSMEACLDKFWDIHSHY